MAALPSTGITTSMVANAIGVGSNDVGTLCSHSNVNKWSRYKPISYAANVLTDNVRSTETGFVSSDETTGYGTVQKLNYVTPSGGATSPYRLGDFRGYNHSAQAYRVVLQNIIYYGAPSGTNIFMGSSDSQASFYVDVYLPEFPIWFLPNNGDAGVIKVVRGMQGTPDYKETVGTIDIASLCSSIIDNYMQNYANKSVRINCTQTTDLPAAGQSITATYYVTIGNKYLLGTAYNKIEAVIYKQFAQNFDDDSQWLSANVSLNSATGITTSDYTYSAIKYIQSLSGMPSGIKLVHFRNAVQEYYIRVEYSYGGNWYQLLDVTPRSGLGSNSEGYTNLGSTASVYASYNDTSNNYLDITLKIANYSGITSVRLSRIAVIE